MAVAMLLACPSARAEINWSWVNAGTGTESGTFTTDGETVGALAPAGSYTILDFSYTASVYGAPVGSVSGGTYFIGMPDIGFEWDGSGATQFWRQSGAWTNGFGLWVTGGAPPDQPDYIVFDVDYFSVENDEEGSTFLWELITVLMTPHQTPVQGANLSDIKALY